MVRRLVLKRGLIRRQLFLPVSRPFWRRPR
jgi:hypothetical protein